jgi:hypothetical protein
MNPLFIAVHWSSQTVRTNTRFIWSRPCTLLLVYRFNINIVYDSTTFDRRDNLTYMEGIVLNINVGLDKLPRETRQSVGWWSLINCSQLISLTEWTSLCIAAIGELWCGSPGDKHNIHYILQRNISIDWQDCLLLEDSPQNNVWAECISSKSSLQAYSYVLALINHWCAMWWYNKYWK